MATQNLQDDLFFLIAYLITSARGLYDEPADYGVFRLLDTTGRLLEIISAHHLMHEPLLDEIRRRIDEEIAGSMDNVRQRESLDEMLEWISAEMARKLDETSTDLEG